MQVKNIYFTKVIPFFSVFIQFFIESYSIFFYKSSI